MATHPERVCLKRHNSNSTLEYHSCMCSFDYSYLGHRMQSLKMKHCVEENKLLEMTNFYTYLGIVAVIAVLIIIVIGGAISCKLYFDSKQPKCKCCNSKLCKKVKKQSNEDHIDSFNNGQVWVGVEQEIVERPESPRQNSACMNFCLSEPVQDCCQFFDCDLLWRKGTLYTLPIFGRRKPPQQHFHRRPSRPAPPPPPPKAVVIPQMKYVEQIEAEEECEPVPEAPPSPEPIRSIPSKSLYVDPLTFLQKPFLKSPEREEEKSEPLYTKFKNMVMSRVKKTTSMSSINNAGICEDPSGMSPDGMNNSRNLRTGSLASLHNLHDGPDSSISSGSKRSLSLASLHMLDVKGLQDINHLDDPRSRISVVSTATDDIPPSLRKDEYIDLEEMSRRMAAKMNQVQAPSQPPISRQYPNIVVSQPMIFQPPLSDTHINSTLAANYTPTFIPASAYSKVSSIPIRVSDTHANKEEKQYIPFPIAAALNIPAVPGRVIEPVGYMTSPQSFSRPKPTVPPRPMGLEISPRSSMKNRPNAPPPPPPPQSKIPIPIESSI